MKGDIYILFMEKSSKLLAADGYTGLLSRISSCGQHMERVFVNIYPRMRPYYVSLIYMIPLYSISLRILPY